MARQLRRSFRFATGLFALIIGLFAPLARVWAQGAGSVGAVNPSATGTPPGGAARSLAIGTSVVRNERLQTSPTGTLHVTFNDRTTLNLGPNTNLVINQYVYDPASGNGSLQASVTSGLLRFVGGQTSHDGAATVTTPVATIGIRGNMVVVRSVPGRGWEVTSLAPGVIQVSNRVSSVVIERPGFSVLVTGIDQVIPEPTRADPASVDQAFSSTISRVGQTGGSKRRPTDADLARQGLGSTSLPSASGSPLDYLSIFSAQTNTGRNAARGRQPRQVVPKTPPPPVTQPAPVTTNPYGTR